MRAPLRVDIQRRDLAWAMLWALCSQRSDGALAEIRRNWQALGGCAEPLVALSVRSAFDLFLGVRKLPPGSEVAISAITHPDMPRLLRAHGLVPVPVDIEAATLAPSLDSVERALSPRTRALMLTHLLGGSVSTGSFLPLCAAKGLEVWEDCAQRFPKVASSGGSAVSFYSFGPLKTSTALLGAVVEVRDPEVRARMSAQQATYPEFPRLMLAQRTGKLAVLAELACHPRVYGGLVHAAESLGWEARGALRTATKSFGATTNLDGLRFRPSAGTLELLARRLRRNTSHAGAKTELAETIATELGVGRVLGHASGSHHWLLVVHSADRDALQRRLYAAGFDALRGISNLQVLAVPDERPDVCAPRAHEILEGALVVPIHHDYSPDEVKRLTDCLRAAPRGPVTTLCP